MPTRLPVYNVADIPKEVKLHEGRMTRYAVRTKHAQVVFANIKPQPLDQQKYHRKPHDHPFDMMLIVMEGEMHMEVDYIEYDLPAGSVMIIPAYIMHRGHAVGAENASLIEVFAPARADYIHLCKYQQEDFGDQGEAWVKPELDSWNAPD